MLYYAVKKEKIEPLNRYGKYIFYGYLCNGDYK